MDGTSKHIAVLVDEVVAGLRVRPGGRYLDATLGAGGHAASILRASAPDGQVLGLDTDAEAVDYALRALRPFGARVIAQVANFRSLESVVSNLGFDFVDGVLLDLGFSSRQMEDAERGFSFAREGPLDMRLDRRQDQTAADLVNLLPEAELADLLWRFGEERHSRRIARAIVRARPVSSTTDLAELVKRSVGHRERIHPATRTFQALRIAVNDEIDNLSETLPQARNVLRPGGRLAVISFHSLEDRPVKHWMRKMAKDCICPPHLPQCRCNHRRALKIITRKPVLPSALELQQNPMARSAKLRVGERI